MRLKRIFTKEEKDIIAKMFYDGVSIREIAKNMHSADITVSDYLKENNFTRKRKAHNKQNHEKFIERMKYINSDTEILGDYVDANTNILVKCKFDDYEWEARPAALLKGMGCPVCANKVVLKGVNDMWTTEPNMAILLLNHNDGYIYTKASKKVLKWKCPNCGNIIELSPFCIYNNNKRLSCTKCSDSISTPEKFMYNLLSQLKINFIYQYTPEWIKPKRYDFYLKDYNIIVETNGCQHYEKNHFENLGGRKLEEEIRNDLYKINTALQNGITDVISLDCSNTDFDCLVNTVLGNDWFKSNFDFSLIDWNIIRNNISKSIIVDVCNLWNTHKFDTIKSLSDYCNLFHMTVTKYLKIGGENGWCDFGETVIYECDSNNNIINKWESKTDIINNYNINIQSLHRALNGTNKNHTFRKSKNRWYYKKDYEKIINM